ncbi:MAG: N-6 DNA methylase, partial [Sulfurimonas sp.]
GIPPRGYGDLAFVQHMVSVLKNDGRMGVVLPHGILFRGGTEGKIRQGLLNDDIVEAIVGLPEKLFYNTGIPASIIIINKSKAPNLKNKVVFIDASNEYKDGKNQNTLSEENIKKIVDAHTLGVGSSELLLLGVGTSVPQEDWTKVQAPFIDKFMRVVDMSEIVENDYNLNISRYIDTSEEEIIIDIKAVREDITELENKEKEIDRKLNDYLTSLGF